MLRVLDIAGIQIDVSVCMSMVKYIIIVKNIMSLSFSVVKLVGDAFKCKTCASNTTNYCSSVLQHNIGMCTPASMIGTVVVTSLTKHAQTAGNHVDIPKHIS